MSEVRTRTLLLNPASPPTAGYVVTAAELGLSGEKVLGTDVIMAGTLAAQPAASLAGRLYLATDDNGGTLYRDSGTAWVKAADQVTQSGGAPTGASYVTTAAEAGLSAEKVLGTDVIMAGTLAARPAASLAGRLYLATDDNGGTLYRDSGSAWVKAADQVTQGGGAPTDAEYWVNTAHGSLSAEKIMKVVRKTADESVTNSATLQDDDHLVLAVAANEVWLVKLFLRYNGPAAGDFKFGFTIPAGASGEFFYGRLRVADNTWLAATAAISGSAVGVGLDSTSTRMEVLLEVILIVGGTAGNLQFQWAQDTADPTATKVLTNSCLVAWKLA